MEEGKRSPSLHQSTRKSADDGILVVDKSGTVTPLNQGPAQGWRSPQAGKTLPLNQRFARMWRIPQRVVERLALENALRRALRREEFTVHYQPQADVDTGEIVGMEALVRWQHPKRGLVSPGEFIPLAEETGLIMPLGEWVLRTACAQDKAWQEASLRPLRVAVNLSARQFQQPNVVDLVARVLKETRLEPDYLELEITESLAMQNADSTIVVLRDLREMGIRISIDDFGAGYSSLGYLKKFAIHTLKIDRSIVDGLTRGPNDAAIAAAIIAMGHSLSLEVVAEGVETEDQLAFLRERQCDRFQGYLLSQPMPVELCDTILE
jgi:EAL domain-containing protein (putative c-di-GMP-specific phosphodiesterase class I)